MHALTYCCSFVLPLISFRFLCPVPLFLSNLSNEIFPASGAGVAGLPGSPVSFTPPSSVKRYTAQINSRHDVQSFIALRNHPGRLSILQNHDSADTGSALGAGDGSIGEVDVLLSSVRPVLK